MLLPRPQTLGQLAVLAVLLFTVRAYEAPDSKKLHETRKLIREVSSSTYTAAAEADRVISLPGWGDLDTGLFAGYVTVDKLAGRALYYVFVEAKTSPETSPVLLWLNGGPGCSSIGGGFMSELGPFYPAGAGGKLQANPHSWHHFANVIFLDSPAFVGFSYSNTSSDKYVGDARTAKDSRRFLQGFFQRYPQYAASDFWITGESYAGHYVPNLAWEILRPRPSAEGGVQEEEEEEGAKINLKGIMVGNAWTDTATDNEGAADFWWSHAVISDDSVKGMKATCDFSRIGPLKGGQRREGAAEGDDELYVSAASSSVGSSRPTTTTPAASCDVYCNQAMDEMGAINIYDILADVCLADGPFASAPAATEAVGAGGSAQRQLTGYAAAAGARGRGPRRHLAAARQLARMLRDAPAAATLSLRAVLGEGEVPPYDACVDDEVEAYLNLPEVQKALHAAPVPWRWTDCSRAVQYSYLDLLASVLPVYRHLLDDGSLRILVFSGDVDAIVPVIGSRRWVAALGRPVLAPWKAWTSSTKQVGGYIVDYDGISFATVRGAGHMVPYVQPERASALISAFLARSS